MGKSDIKSLDLQLQNFTKDQIQSISVEHYKTGFKFLDEKLSGGITPGLTVLGAMPGLGKSTFMFQTALNIARSGKPVLIFSFEMSKTQIAAKLITHQAFVNSKAKSHISVGNLLNYDIAKNLDEKQWKVINKARDDIAQGLKNIYIIERKDCDANADLIVKETNKFIESNNQKPLVIVDYLQILGSEQGNLSDKQLTDRNIATMSKLASENNIPVILISAVSRSSYDKALSMASFKDSGNIEYSADTLLALQFIDKESSTEIEKSKVPREVEIFIVKQRLGETGSSVKFNYYSEFDTFEETDLSDEEEDVKNYNNLTQRDILKILDRLKEVQHRKG